MDSNLTRRNEKEINENLYKKINKINKEKEFNQNIENIKKRSTNIRIIYLILLLVGLANFYSAIIRFDDAVIFTKFFKNLVIVIISISAFVISSKINFKLFSNRKVRILFLCVGVILFLIVAYAPIKSLFPRINGGKGWIRIGGAFSLQVTEIFKIAYIIILASIFSRGKDSEKNRKHNSPIGSAILYFLIFGFLITVPLSDFGTAIHYFLIICFLIFMSDISDRLLWGIISIGLFLGSIASFLFYKFGECFGYMHHRLKIFVDGILTNQYDRFEAYQIYQSLVGFGTGGIIGKGYGNGVQKYNYIPEVETDFAISTFGEEMGLLGMFFLLITFLILFILIMNVAENSKTFFGKYLAAGVGGYFIIQVLINIGVAVGLIPILGIPLPFISSGGSSLLTLSIALGIVININNSELKDL